MRYITHGNGDIQFIHRGNPPMVVPGYEPDDGDPYLFHPILPPCNYRKMVLLVLSCCPNGKQVKQCTKHGYIALLPEICKICVENGQNQ